MLQFDPTDPEDLAFTLHKAVKQSGLSLAQIAQRLAVQRTCADSWKLSDCTVANWPFGFNQLWAKS